MRQTPLRTIDGQTCCSMPSSVIQVALSLVAHDTQRPASAASGTTPTPRLASAASGGPASPSNVSEKHLPKKPKSSPKQAPLAPHPGQQGGPASPSNVSEKHLPKKPKSSPKQAPLAPHPGQHQQHQGGPASPSNVSEIHLPKKPKCSPKQAPLATMVFPAPDRG